MTKSKYTRFSKYFIESVVFCMLFLPVTAYASSLAFLNLTTSDYQGALKDISSAWSYTSVSGASDLGHVFGFEVGLVGGGADTPKINSLSQAAGTGAITELPSAQLFGAVTVPFGITIEAEGLPSTSVDGVSAKSDSLALKWTFSQLLNLPLDMSVKAFGSWDEFNFAGNVGSPSIYTTFDLSDDMTGAVFEASKKFLIFEPYVEAGIIQARGKMDVSGSTQVFSTGVMSDTETVSGSMLMVGTDLNLGILRLGAEVGSVFNDTRAAAKLSLYF